MSKLRILFYMPNFAWGGAGNIIFSLLNNLDNSKFEKSLIVNFDEGELKNLVNTNITMLPPLMEIRKRVAIQLPYTILKLSCILRNYDILVCGLEMATDYIGILARALMNKKTKVVVFFLSDVYEFVKELPNRRVEMILTKYLTRFADTVIFTTKLQQQKYQQDFRIKTGIVQYPPLDIEKVQKMGQESIEGNIINPPNKKLFISYGRFATHKRFDIIINAFRYLKNYNCSLLLIGDGPTKNYLVSLTKKYGLESMVSFLPYTLNPYKYLKHSFAFLYAGNYESFGLVIVESFALGKPVIATPTYFGPIEIIKHNENGLISKDFQPENYALEIKKLLTDSKLYQRLACGASKSAQDFNIKKVIRQFEKLLLSL